MTDVSLDQLRSRGAGTLVELLGIEFLSADSASVSSRLAVRPVLLAPNGYLHASAIVALADTSCGYGSMNTLPAGAQGFTTIELKTNFLGTVRTGGLACTAVLLHGGRTTQVWDATVSDEATGKTIALFRCTQLLLYPHGG
jgi:1,4-dihydroxy-2-naphthoyl-CoA hydrolase